MRSNNIYDKLMRIYEENHARNLRIQQQKKEKLGTEHPEYKELEHEIITLRADLAKSRILGSITEDEVADMNAQIEQKAKELDEMLLSFGYPADYLTVPYTCNDCMDTAMIGTTPCHCLTEAKIKFNYELSGVTLPMRGDTFANFDFTCFSETIPEGETISSSDNMKNILKKVNEFTQTFGDNQTNLLFLGQTGLGKTYLSRCIANQLLNDGYTVFYASAADLFDHIIGKAVMDKENCPADVRECYENLTEVDLLIIDDLGTEYTNNFTSTEFFQLINDRILKGKSTLISTNLTLMDMQNRYGDRTSSRLVESYETCRFFGTNIRYLKQAEKLRK